jgi:hypothetical protein
LITNDPNVDTLYFLLLLVLFVIIQPTATAATAITGHRTIASSVKQEGCDV